MDDVALVGLIGLGFLMLCFFLEALVLLLFRICRLGRAFLLSLLVNLISLLVIYLGWPLTRFFHIDMDSWFPLFPFLFIITVSIETLMLQLMNRQEPWTRLLAVAINMNVLSFTALYVVLTMI